MPRTALAKRYAQALLQATEPADWDSLSADLNLLAAAWQRSADFRRALSDPGLPDERKTALALGLLEAQSPALERLLRLLFKRHRLVLLPDLASTFEELAAEAAGKQLATVLSPLELSEAQLERLRKALVAFLGKPVILRTTLRPDLLGGVTVKIGDRFYDGSLQGALAQLERTLAQAPLPVE